MVYIINGKEFELYQAGSEDWCVSIYEFGKDRVDYNIGEYVSALEFILENGGCIYE